ncbi:flavin-containing monooxygenase [Streptomyces sp. NPDC057939]|uniref:flavin-containing monooxygenase n=1 Tax=Streptomyces sp. NPDC057939 TaxID=3346284 RepID=UPI0036E6D1B9
MPSAPEQPSATATLDALVIGAGFAGLYQLYRLRELGLRVRAFEACDDVGGTWFRNRYPGARCDIESTAYSYSFSPELDQEWRWSERYATQPELLRYLRHVAERFDLRKDIVLRTRVIRAAYDEQAHTWRVTTDTGDTVDARFVVLATGCMSVAREPDLPGAATFSGRALHTADWPLDGVDLTGQRVAVIGTGCSGVQAIPLLARQAASLTVFQRTAVYALPARNRPLGDAEVAALKADYPQFRAAQRRSGGGTVFEPPTRSALEVEESERTAAYQKAWESGLLSGLLRTYTDVLVRPEANETVAEFVRSKIREIVTDPATAASLTPRGFPYGTKRPCLDTDYYDTYNAPHVAVVDLAAEPITRITPGGIRTGVRHHPVDVIVHATGFDAMTGSQLAIDITGKAGTTLREKWAAGPRNHLGLLAAGFPNLFTVTGPLSPSVLSNAVTAIEQHVEWITACVAHLRENSYTEIDATAAAEDAWCEHVNSLADQTLYPGVASWYNGANIPDKPRTFLAYTGGLDRYRALCEDSAANDYTGFTLSRRAPAGVARRLPSPSRPALDVWRS